LPVRPAAPAAATHSSSAAPGVPVWFGSNAGEYAARVTKNVCGCVLQVVPSWHPLGHAVVVDVEAHAPAAQVPSVVVVVNVPFWQTEMDCALHVVVVLG
jgi:hypothetical protein